MRTRMSRSTAGVLLAVVIAALSLSGCALRVQGDYAEYAVSENHELGCVELTRLDTVYRPYGIIPVAGFRGGQVGKRSDDPDAILCQVKDYPTTEWIVEHFDVFMGSGDMLFKAVGVTDIPGELGQFKQYSY